MASRFYTYLLKQTATGSFYVGKGTGDRVNRSLIEHNCDVIVFVYFAESEESAFRLEDKIWQEMSKRGHLLLNASRPGRYGHCDNRSGRVWPSEVKEKIRETNIVAWSDPDRLQHLRELNVGRRLSEESRLKISASKRGKRLSPETKGKISQATREALQNPDVLQKMKTSAVKREERKRNATTLLCPDSETGVG